jgi:hypothetical protein
LADVRLGERILAMLSPHWGRHPKMTLSQALRRYWPGGRASPEGRGFSVQPLGQA